MAARKMIVPPGGFAGFAQQTQAVQALLGPRRKKRTTKKRTTKKRTTKKRVTKKRAAKKKTGGRLKKGSPAAKRRMAQLRRMQKRNRR